MKEVTLRQKGCCLAEDAVGVVGVRHHLRQQVPVRTCKTVKSYIRQSSPDSSKYKTVKSRFWHV